MAVEQTGHHHRIGEASRTFEPLSQPTDFSLVMGGPLYQLCRRSRLTGNEMQLLPRRVLAVLIVAWVPLLLLSVAEGHAWGRSVGLPFFYDIEMQIRLLLVGPLLVAAELLVHRRLRSIVVQFLERNLIPDTAQTTFEKAITSAMRLRNSVWAEVFLVAFVYVVGVGLFWRSQIGVNGASWYNIPANGAWRLSMTGWWLAWVSMPLFQFLLLRWYFRLFIWARFLWHVSRIPLNLLPTHPDRCGGLAFLGNVRIVFGPLLLAQGMPLSGMMANRIFYAGAKLQGFKVELIGLVAVIVLAVLGPLLVFCGQLERTKLAGLREYGILAQRYVREYDRKWLRGGGPPDEAFLGSADIQSLADLSNSFEVIKEMKWMPFSARMILELAVTALVPVVPLMLTMISLEELVDRLLKVIF